MSDQRDTTQQQVLRALRQLMQVTDLEAKHLARHYRLTASQLLVLQMLQSRGQQVIGQLAREVGLAQATVTSLVDRLQSRGLVRRERGSTDRRQVHVMLTDAGRDLLAAAPAPLQVRFLRNFDSLADWEQTAILAALQRLTHLMDAHYLEAAPVLDVGALDRSAET